MTALNRHSWSLKFADWISSQGLTVISTKISRAGGVSELLEIGIPNKSQRPTLIFLHGLGNDLLFPNINFFRSLLFSGCNLVTCDLDGHGQDLSSMLTEEDLPTLVDDMIVHSQFCREKSDGVHLAGFSLGAVLTLDYASRHPKNVKTISLIGMPLILQGDFRIASEGLSPFLRSYREALRDYGIFGIQPALGPILRGRYPIRLHPGERSSYLEVAGRIIRALQPTQKLQSLQCPANYIAGSLDFISYPKATAKFLDDLKDKPHIHRQILPAETHFSIMLARKTPSLVSEMLRNIP